MFQPIHGIRALCPHAKDPLTRVAARTHGRQGKAPAAAATGRGRGGLLMVASDDDDDARQEQSAAAPKRVAAPTQRAALAAPKPHSSPAKRRAARAAEEQEEQDAAQSGSEDEQRPVKARARSQRQRLQLPDLHYARQANYDGDAARGSDNDDDDVSHVT